MHLPRRPGAPALPLLLILFAWTASDALAQRAANEPVVAPELHDQLVEHGRARVIVELRTQRVHQAEGRIARSRALAQRREIADAQGRLLQRLLGMGFRVVHRYRTVPYVALEVDAATLAELESSGSDVERVMVDRLAKPMLADSVPLVEADYAWSTGLDGNGFAIAILDTGVDTDHEFLAGTVIDEACFASGDVGSPGSCPNGQEIQFGTGAGEACAYAPNACRHGTHVAGIAAGSGPGFSGVAPGADLIAIQIFHSTTFCAFGEENPCARAYFSDVTAALEHVYELSGQHSIAAVNMSIGASIGATGPCDADDPELVAIIDNLESVGIATVVSSGNGSRKNALDFPACISTAISVGATTKTDDVAWYSNVSDDLDLFAPGDYITSSVPGDQYAIFGGTSMAAPHVAGAIAILRQATPGATVGDMLAELETTGRPVVDDRSAALITKPRIRVGAAVGFEAPTPAVTAITPDETVAWRTGDTVTVTGSGFIRGSVIFVDGEAIPTTYVDADELTGALSAAHLDTSAMSLAVTVVTPPPGGGASNPVTLTLRQPQLTVDTTTVAGGSEVTVTLVDGPGSQWAWLGLHVAGDPDTNFADFTYVGDGITDRTWTVTAPDVPGDYDFRLFYDIGYQRLASSEIVHVDPAPPPPPPDPTQASLTVDKTQAEPGETITATLTDGFGNAYDWLALAEVGSPDAAYVEFSYVGAGVTDTTWSIAAPSAPGQYEFRYFLDNGYTRMATSDVIVVAPSTPPPDPTGPELQVDVTAVTTGDQITVTLSGGPGGALDWLAFADVGAPDSSYVEYRYVGTDVTDTTWTVTAPATPGQYEFRLFLDNGYERAATSEVVVVAAPPPPDPADLSLDVDLTSVLPGDTVTLSVTAAPGGATDWLALAAVGAPDASHVQWTYVGAGVTDRTWVVTMPTTPGDYEFRLFLDNGYERAATSATVTVEDVPAAPQLTVDTTAAAPGGSVTVTLTGGAGNLRDWLSFASTDAPDSSYLYYTYVGVGETERTWTVTMPSTPGDYEFRLYYNDSYVREATSPTVSLIQ